MTMTQPRSLTVDNRWLTLAAIFLSMTVGWLAYKSYKSLSPIPTEHTTSILTWWGYLDHKGKIKELETLCDTKLKVYEYSDTADMENFAAAKPYDLYIYPWGYHRDIEPHFEQAGPKVNWMVDSYHPTIRDKYLKLNISQDTVFFQHATWMFVYDQQQIADINRLTAADIIKLTQSDVGKVLLMDDLYQVDWLIKQVQGEAPEAVWSTLRHEMKTRQVWNQVNDSGLRLSNYVPNYLDNRLILGVLDSGELMNPNFDWGTVKDASGQPKALRFGVHPRLSHVSSDVLALKSDDPRHQCVALAMSTRSFLQWIAETSFYFSPFEEVVDTLPESLQQLTQEFYDTADQLPWLDELLVKDPPSPEAELIWQVIRACQRPRGCGEWAAISDRVFAGST